MPGYRDFAKGILKVAYNRVALTDYFQHRNVEKLYLNQGMNSV